MQKYILNASIIGQGEPIVLVHGFMSSSHYYKTMRQRLAKDHTVITLDLLGFGHSPKPSAYVDYDMQVQSIHDTLHKLGIDQPFIMIGHSMGALVSLRYANTHPTDVKSVQLFNPPIFNNEEQAHQTIQQTSRRYRALFNSPRRRLYWMAIKLLPRNILDKRPEVNFTDTLRASRHAREGGYQRIILAAELLQDLDKSKTPVLLIVGKYDRLVYRENLDDYKIPTNVHLQVVETGHHTIAKEPDLAESLIRQHL